MKTVLQQGDVGTGSGRLEGVVEQLTHFRSEVRAFALARQDAPTSGPPHKAALYPERGSLLRSCDTLRKDLAPLGVLIKVCGWVGSGYLLFVMETGLMCPCFSG